MPLHIPIYGQLAMPLMPPKIAEGGRVIFLWLHFPSR